MTYEEYKNRRLWLISVVKERISKVESMANPSAAWALNSRNRDILALLEGDYYPVTKFTVRVMKECDHPAFQGWFKKLLRVKYKPMKLYARLQAAGYTTVTVENVEFLGRDCINQTKLMHFVHNMWLHAYVGEIK